MCWNALVQMILFKRPSPSSMGYLPCLQLNNKIQSNYLPASIKDLLHPEALLSLLTEKTYLTNIALPILPWFLPSNLSPIALPMKLLVSIMCCRDQALICADWIYNLFIFGWFGIGELYITNIGLIFAFQFISIALPMKLLVSIMCCRDKSTDLCRLDL